MRTKHLSGSLLTIVLLLNLAPAADAVAPERVAFFADRLRISADYYTPPAGTGAAPAVLLLHDHAHDRTSWAPLIESLHRAGFAVLAIDLRGHGDSTTTETLEKARAKDPALFRDMQEDLRAAYDWLAQQERIDRARLAIVAAGVGANVAWRYAAEDRSVDAIVALSPKLRACGLDAPGDIHQIAGRQILLLGNASDRDAVYSLQKRNKAVQVKIYAHTDEAGTELLNTARGIEREIVDFLKKGVGKPTSTVVYGSIRSHIYHSPDSAWIAEISPTNLRYYSSPAEAQARGLRASKSKGPRKARRG
jgi:dienelactone hydrolase